jgi:hypothetical protein
LILDGHRWHPKAALRLVQCDGGDEATIANCHEALAEPNTARGSLDTLIDASAAEPHAAECGEGAM